jgi:hypothetical protein
MEKTKLDQFLALLSRSYMMESFYSVWKPEAKHILTIINVPKEEHNLVYLAVVKLAVDHYGNEILPFIINVGTVVVSSDPLSDSEIDDMLNVPIT